MANQQSLILGTDIRIEGNLSVKTMTLPAASVLDTNVSAYSGQGNGIGAAKLQQQWQKEYGQPKAAAISEQKVIHVTRGQTYTILEFSVWCSVAATGNATVTFNLLQNGVSRLTSVVTIDNTLAIYTLRAGSLAAYTPAANDIWEVATVATVGTGTLPQGVGAKLALREDPQ